MAAVYGYSDVGTHAQMLVDRARTDAFAEAIARTVKKGDVVVDLGSGSGILAGLCAKAGARRVYAIERGPMAEMVRAMAKENGFDSVIEVVRDDARDVEFADPPNVIVSEMIGSFGLDEDYRGLLGTVRQKCAPQCAVIPGSIEILIAPAQVAALTEEVALVSSGYGVRLSALAERLMSRVAFQYVDGADLCGEAVGSRHDIAMPLANTLGGKSLITRAADVNALVAWFRSELVPGVTITSAPTSPRTHWANVMFPLDPPVRVVPGDVVDVEVRPRLFTDRGTWAWSLAKGDERRRGDGMRAFVGDSDDWLRQLGVARAGDPPQVPATDGTNETAPLARLAAALAGKIDAPAAMAQRLRGAFPDRYVDDDDAAQDVLRLLRVLETA